MKYLCEYKKFNEAKEHYHYYVVIEWEHGGSDRHELQRYPFKSEEEMDEFLKFIYDVRKFIPDSGWANAGHFSDGHYERERKWIEKVDSKYGNKFSHLIPNDRKFGGGDYSPSIEHIWIEQDGVPLNIVWEKALKTNIIDLPKIGDKIKTNIGNISYYGPTLWGKKNNMNYLSYEDFKHWDEDDQCKECDGNGWVKDYDKGKNIIGEYDEKRCPSCDGERKYSNIEPIVTDCRIHLMDDYERKDYKYNNDTDTEELISSYKTHTDYTSFVYVLLCEFADGYITVDMDEKTVGFDPNFESKYHYPKYGTNDYYLVR